MDDSQIQRFNKLSSEESRHFVLLYFGLHCFINNIRLKRICDKNDVEDSKWKDILFSYRYTFRFAAKGNRYPYICYDGKSKELNFFSDQDKRIEHINSFPADLSPLIVDLLLDAVKERIDLEYTKPLLELYGLLKVKKNYRFVLGAGVSLEYGALSLKDIGTEFETKVDRLLGKGTTSNIKNDVFNVGYGEFQILKDIAIDDYHDILKNMISRLSNPKDTDTTTLAAIANVIASQSQSLEKQRVLTFNYDDLLERSLETLSMKNVKSYWGVGAIKDEANIAVLHPHGYLPKSMASPTEFDKYKDSVVLTSEEYFAAYASSRSIAYSMLYEHLDETCYCIGNSVTDYEEQKVLSKHFSDCPSSFHYVFLVDEEDILSRTNLYRSVFLLKIGLIPIWFNSHGEYRDMLMDSVR